MAFEKKFKPQNDEKCPVCRKSIKAGKRIIADGYQANGTMCSTCFKHLYKNRSAKRTVGFIDDSSNFITKFLPAPVLEKPLLFKREFITNYEYRMADITEMSLIHKNCIWLLIMLVLAAALKISGILVSSAAVNACNFAVNILFVFGSVIIGFANIKDLIKGLFLGMGHPRRIILIVFIAVLTMVIVSTVKQLI